MRAAASTKAVWWGMRLANLLTHLFLFVCTVVDFSAAEKDRGVKFCMRVGLLSGQVFSPFGEHWLAGSHGGGGISHRPWVGSADCAVVIYAYDGQWALGIAGGSIA